MTDDTIALAGNGGAAAVVKIGDMVTMVDGSTRRVLRINHTPSVARLMLGIADHHVGAWFFSYGGAPCRVRAPSIDVAATAKALTQAPPRPGPSKGCPVPSAFDDAAFAALIHLPEPRPQGWLEMSADQKAAAAVVWAAALAAATRAVRDLARAEGQYPSVSRIIQELTALKYLAQGASREAPGRAPAGNG